jgi:hypothetical protein
MPMAGQAHKETASSVTVTNQGEDYKDEVSWQSRLAILVV